MKKQILTAVFLLSGMSLMAQNVQLHYDFGHHLYNDHEEQRQPITATFEQFKADNLGSWFYFIDLDIDSQGMMGAYTEISREFNVSNSGLAAHIEYDGGLSRDAGSFQTSTLFGPAWNGHSADFSKTYSVQVLYKQYFGQHGKGPFASFQLTGVWGLSFLDNKMSFSGFMDLWLDKKADGSGDHCLVFLSEPQLWYNLSDRFSVGTEVEISNNFIYSNCDYNNNRFFVNPTLAVKYNF